jgi:cell division protein ZapA
MASSDPYKQTVRVSIFNQSYVVSTSGDPREIEELAAEIDDLMSSIARRTGSLDSARTAVLACLHLADRLRTAERAVEAVRHSLVHKTRDLALLLDQALLENENPPKS